MEKSNKRKSKSKETEESLENVVSEILENSKEDEVNQDEQQQGKKVQKSISSFLDISWVLTRAFRTTAK